MIQQLSKRAILWIHNPFCFVCGNMIESYADSSIEHIVPKSLGGTEDPHNLAVSHKICNQLKSNSLDRKEWLQKIEYVNTFGTSFIFQERMTKFELGDHGLYFILNDLFSEYEFVELNCTKIPRHFIEYDSIICINRVKNPIRKLKNLKFEALVSSSIHIDELESKNYWRLIFGILFLEIYQQDFDQIALLHALWRLDTFKKNLKKNLIFWEFADVLIDICKNFEPEVFQKYENLVALKSSLEIPSNNGY